MNVHLAASNVGTQTNNDYDSADSEAEADEGRKCVTEESGFFNIRPRAECRARKCRCDRRDGRHRERVQYGTTVIVDDSSERRCGHVQDGASVSMADVTKLWRDDADSSNSVVYPISRIRPPICGVDEEQEDEHDSDGAGKTAACVRVAEEGTQNIHYVSEYVGRIKRLSCPLGMLSLSSASDSFQKPCKS